MKAALVALYLAMTAAFLTAAGGWMANIYKLVDLLSHSMELTGEVIIRGAGIVIPVIGVIAGFC
ncbi:hypothetical protein [Brucella sp. 10RB9210]|uniref:hypothetical protein n=1 Tax=Brucella sp. 10RB9210 TaxID=1844037 RepID=UPI0012AD9736|nr:hypothetical protein [Brucella sp. 10RB9210]MRN79472.1 hypothetical protein [Brucella sp. 10RB9210]